MIPLTDAGWISVNDTLWSGGQEPLKMEQLHNKRPPRFLIAPDKFKGSLTSTEVAIRIAQSILKVIPSAVIDLCPIADGGDGSLAIAENLE